MLVYVAGPYRNADPEVKKKNIENCKQVAIQLWNEGHTVICPHTNSGFFDEDQHWEVGDNAILTRYCDLLSRCDHMVVVGNWENSQGTFLEINYAESLGIPITYADLSFAKSLGVPAALTFPLVELHPTEVRSPNQCRAFAETLGKMYRIHLKKNADYSPLNILLTGQIGVVVRLWDKVARLLNLSGLKVSATVQEVVVTDPDPAANESIEDSFVDAAVYSIIGLLVRLGKWGN